MTLKGLLGRPFNIKVKMDSAIAESHKALFKNTGGGVVINTVDGFGEHALHFTELNYNDEQNLNVTGQILGSHNMLGITTTPYYVDSTPTLKETKKEFRVQIVTYIGWEVLGSTIGVNVFPLAVASLVIPTASPDVGFGLQYKLKSVIGGNGITFNLVLPNGVVLATDTDILGEFTFTANQVGTYTAYAFTRGSSQPAAVDFTENLVFTNAVTPLNEAPLTVTIPGVPVLQVSAVVPTQHLVDGTTPDSATFEAFSTQRDVKIRGLAQSLSAGFSPSGLAGTIGGYFYSDDGYVASNNLTWSLPAPFIASTDFTLANYYTMRLTANPADPLQFYGPTYDYGSTQLTLTFAIP